MKYKKCSQSTDGTLEKKVPQRTEKEASMNFANSGGRKDFDIGLKHQHIVQKVDNCKININSTKSINFSIVGIFNKIKDTFPYLFRVLSIAGRNSAFVFKISEVVDMIEKLLLLPETKRKAKAEVKGIELDNWTKQMEFYSKKH